MMNTLGLDDDLGMVEVVINLETSFSIRFADAEVGAWRTVGDIYSTLRSRVSNSGKRAGRCATAMTFRRLRRALSELSIVFGGETGYPFHRSVGLSLGSGGT